MFIVWHTRGKGATPLAKKRAPEGSGPIVSEAELGGPFKGD